MSFPRLSLIVSGGNTQLVFSRSIFVHHILGLTVDDALGEALDKSARLLHCKWADAGGLGQELEKLASNNGFSLGIDINSMENCKDPLSFSFSGLKTALNIFISKNEPIYSKEDLAATIQDTLFGHVTERVENCFKVLQNSGFTFKPFSLIGGVASNKRLRGALEKLCEKYKVELAVPPIELCTDNAIMIGLAANMISASGLNYLNRLNIRRIDTCWSLEEISINKPILE